MDYVSSLKTIEFPKCIDDMGATIYGNVMSVSCVFVVLLTPVLTKIVEAKNNQLKLTAGIVFFGWINFTGPLVIKL